MGLRISTDDKGVKVFKKVRDTKNGGKFATYCLAVSSKDLEGNWLNGYIDCCFKKGVEVNNKAVINIKNAFYTVSEYQDKKYTKIFILDFDTIEAGESEKAVDTSFMDISDGIEGALPFN